MDAIVHIGRPKTGSTTIQSFLSLNKDALVEQGFRYASDLSTSPSQKEFAIAACARAGFDIPKGSVRSLNKLWDAKAVRAYADKFEKAFAKARAQWSDDDTLIISCEQMSIWFRKPEDIRELDAYIRQYADTVRYIVYLRRQEDVIPSSYSQRLKVGQTLTFQEHFAQLSKTLDYNRMVSHWVEAVGKDNLSVSLLEPDHLVNGDLVDDLCALTGIKRAGLETPSRANEALSEDATAVMRALNEIEPFTKPSGDFNTRRKGVLKKLMTLSEGQPRQRLTKDQYKTVRRNMQDSNEALRATYFPERQELFPERENLTFASPENRLNDETIKLALRLSYGAEQTMNT